MYLMIEPISAAMAMPTQAENRIPIGESCSRYVPRMMGRTTVAVGTMALKTSIAACAVLIF
ncbi:hypothetical protein D3C76_1525810 [compost metagenome]